jgi:hypothetical protein
MIKSDFAIEAPPQADDDALFDSWLASMSPREFELILDGLADLEITATQRASA